MSKIEKDVPFTISTIVKFVAERYRFPHSRLSGRMAPGVPPLTKDDCIVVQLDGKDFMRVLSLGNVENKLRSNLLNIIEADELVGDTQILGEVPAKEVFDVVVRHTDLQGLHDWISVSSNLEVRGAMSDSPAVFWSLWNDCGLTPKVVLGGKDEISPSFVMMKKLQSARSKRLMAQPLDYLLNAVEHDYEDALNVVLQECQSFDLSAIVHGLVMLLGGIEGWLEGSCDEIVRGLVINRV